MPMTTQTLTLNLPEPLYQRLEERARQTHRSVEDTALEVLTTAVPVAEDLSPDLAEAISPLSVLDDTALWQAARSRFPTEAAQQLEALHRKRQREGLTEAEAQTVAALVRHYERSMLVRAQAASLLKQRGHDVSSLLQSA
jgi:plasmid stability protein